MATKIIKLAGFIPNKDIDIKVIGLRPGEKLYEELLIGDNVIQSKHPRIMQAREEKVSLEKVENFIEERINLEYSKGVLKKMTEGVGYDPNTFEG